MNEVEPTLPSVPHAIRNRLALSVGAIVVTAVLLTLAGFGALQVAAGSLVDRVDQTTELARAVESLNRALYAEETLALGHAFEPGEENVEMFEAAAERELDAYIAIGRVASSDPEIQALALGVRAAGTEWREEWAEPFLRADPADGQTPAGALATSRELFASVEEALVRLGDQTNARRDEAATSFSSFVGDFARLFLPAIAAIAIVITLAGMSLIRTISGPLTRLNHTAHRLIAGDEVTFVRERDDEIGSLAEVLERMRLDATSRYDTARTDAETAATFNQLAELTSFAQDESTLVEAATRVLQRIAPSPRGQVMLLNNSTNKLIVADTWGDDLPPIGSAADLERTDRCPGIRRATAYTAEDLSDPLSVRCPAHPADSGSVVCLPMPALGSIVGVIHLQRPGSHSFDVPTVQRAARTAEQVALAIANARLMKTMEGLANTDPVTGLRNARFFDAYLEQELLLAERENVSVAVIMLDLDHFKKFNDTHGHPAGDEALRTLGRTLRVSVREADVVARYGGEEFIVALHHATLTEAMAIAEKMRSAIEQTVVEIGPGRYGRITASFGVVATDLHRLDRKALVSLADDALYRAKDAGRNRVEPAMTASRIVKGGGDRRAAGEPLILPVGPALRSPGGSRRVARKGS